MLASVFPQEQHCGLQRQYSEQLLPQRKLWRSWTDAPVLAANTSISFVQPLALQFLAACLVQFPVAPKTSAALLSRRPLLRFSLQQLLQAWMVVLLRSLATLMTKMSQN
jgi:hypothetical protein